MPQLQDADVHPVVQYPAGRRGGDVTGRHTRNSAGKTSLLEIIHFLLGSDATKASLFKHDALWKHSFSVELLLGGRWVRASRSGAQDDIITLSATDAEAMGLPAPLSLFATDENDEVPVSLDTWKAILGAHWFKLPHDRTDTEFTGKGAPSFRTLAGYFVRRRKVGGFDTIEKNKPRSAARQLAGRHLLPPRRTGTSPVNSRTCATASG